MTRLSYRAILPSLALALLSAAPAAHAGGNPTADLRLNIDDARLRVAPGDVVTYEIFVFNAGPSAAPGSTVSDVFPPSLTSVSWTCAGFGGAVCPASGTGDIAATVDLPVAGLVLFTASATVAPGATGTIRNIAFASPPLGVDEDNPDDNREGDIDNVTLDMAELTHGFQQTRQIAGGAFPDGGDFFRIQQRLFSSYEVVVDATSGDIGSDNGPTLERLASDGTLALPPFAVPVGAGPSRSLRWQTGSLEIANQLVHVMSQSCATDCGPEDTYRIRAYDTTYAIPRYNNGGSQTTFLFIQNTTDAPVEGRIVFWTLSGGPISNYGFLLQPRELFVLNTASVVTGGGSVTVAAEAPFGALAGKAVALEPSTGFSFDTPMRPRSR